MNDEPAGTSRGKIRLKDFEKKIRLRRLTLDDYDDLVAMQQRCFPGMIPWGRDQIESQLAIFPGGQLCIEYNGRLVASSNSLIVDYDRYEEWHDWKRVADAGYIRNHAPDGDTLYGIEIMVDPEFRGMHLARRLYNARKALCRELNLARIVIGGRIPGYGAQADAMTAREYVEKVIERGLYDPVLTIQVANGFVLRELIPGYFPSDEASRGYATHLEWPNLDHVRDPQRHWHRVSVVRLCAVQYRMRPIDSWDDFCTQCAYYMDAAADSKADFVLFPELLTTQLLGLQDDRRPADSVRTLALRTPDYLDFFTRSAVKYNVNVIGGSQFTAEGDRLFNVAYLFRRDGTIEQQAKLHVTAEEQRWWGLEAGDRLEVFETDRGRIAILPSYDVLFPELARIATARGAQILFVPFSADDRTSYLRTRYCAVARAVENDVFVAISGCTGNLPFVANADTHYAQSGIFTPLDFSFARDGIAAECTPNIETLVMADVDLELLRRHRYSGTVTPWSDRRDDLYDVVWKPGPDERDRG
ncbi:MAG: GNAT family N-acetyltransferase [Gemmatimonadota bacterium]|jgi:predicted amidohydrolase/ribosomal protein S18 acetylase RimI-like enzyme